MNPFKIIITACVAALLAASCSGGGEGESTVAAPPAPPTAPSAPTRAINFNSGLSSPGTGRATTPLENFAESFGVIAYKMTGAGKVLEMGVKTDVYTPYVVELQTRGGAAGWYYDGIGTQILRYWDFNATGYVFSAYAPLADPAANTVSWDDDGYVSITNVEADTEDATDWLIARMDRDASAPAIADTDLLIDQTIKSPEVLSETVDLLFHRLLAHVEFRIYSGSGEPFDVTAMHLTTDDASPLTTKATYTGTADWNLTARWTPQTTSTSLVQKTLSAHVTGTDRDHATSLAIVREIPQTMLEGGHLTLNLTIDGNDVDLDIDAAYVDWRSDNKYLYVIKYTPGDPVLILAEVVVSDWEYGGEIDNSQDNW